GRAQPMPSIAPAAPYSPPKASATAVSSSARPRASSAPASDAPEVASAAASAPPASSSTASASGAGASDTRSGGTLGAVGRPGVRDLGGAFTQSIPLACVADPLWGKVAAGNVGSIKIAIDIDENGRIRDWKALDEDPPPALKSLARRTIDGLRGGTFA